MKRSLFFITVLCGGLAIAQNTGKVGIQTNNPTETLDVKGTVRVQNLPENGSSGSISTPRVNTDFNATKTVVVDENGVLGVVDGTPVTKLPSSPEIPKTIQYVTKTVLINENTPTNSEIKLGNIVVRFNGTEPRGGEESVSFKLIGAKTLDGEDANADNVICNGMKIGSGGGPYGGQNSYFSAQKNEWQEVTAQRPNINNNDFAIYNILLLNTREVYRLTVSLNTSITSSSPNVNSSAQVSLFLERLTNADGISKS